MRQLHHLLSSLFIITLILLSTPERSAGQYRNDWIDYDKTYWKFRTGTDGIYRIPKAALDAAGIPSGTPGNQFMLFRDGQEIAIFTSTDAAFATTDYIEFYGTMANGLPDKKLYLDTSKIADEKRSIFSDTAAYFLTVSTTAGHLRYQPVTTPIPASPPAAATYCWETLSYHGRGSYLSGRSLQRNEQFHSSQFEAGEGFIDITSNAGDVKTLNFSTPEKVNAAVNATLRLSSLAFNYYDSVHHLRVTFNGTEVANTDYGVADVAKLSIPIAASSLAASNTMTTNHYNTAPSPDWYGLAYWELDYPRSFNVNGLNYFRFRMPVGSSNQYIEFINFDHGGTSPRLYDLTHHKMYSGDISISGKTRFYIDGELDESDCVLYTNNSGKVYPVTASRQVRFTNYATASNQGNYIIISHKNLMGAGGAHDYVADYKNYRNSVSGGNYKAIVADIEDLYDQFAYGIDMHPLSIRHFLDMAYDQWTTRPEYVFLVGKAIRPDVYKAYQLNSNKYAYTGMVPAYGHPGSDIDFVNNRSNWKMNMAISRLSAWNATEVGDYLNKVKAYENAVRASPFPKPETEFWKKQVLHIAGGNYPTPYDIQSTILLPTLNNCADIVRSLPAGAQITTIAKNTKGEPSTIQDKTIDSMVSNGVSMITYYGHGSAYVLDYNLRDPSYYSSSPKVPFFSAFGCAISDIFDISSSGLKSVSENWVAAPSSGAISSFGGSTLGFTNFHSAYMPVMYSFINGRNYGQAIGNIYKSCNDSMTYLTPGGQTSASLNHLESYILQGDPAVKMPLNLADADYYVGNETVSSIPVNVTTALDSFRMRIVSYNLSAAKTDTVKVKVEHSNPSGTTTTVKTYTILNLWNTDTSFVYIPVDKTKDIGLNKYKITIDPDNRYTEVSEANNTAAIDLFISADNLTPLYPKNFGIVYQPSVTLKASTLNVFRGKGSYRMEIDTTELFNSPSKLSTVLSGLGGVVKWTPSLTMKDSTVYYWRCAIDSIVSGSYNWANSSFIYLKNGSDGWNQSHYYQYKNNSLDAFEYNSSRQFKYLPAEVGFQVINTITELPAPYEPYKFSPYNKITRNGSDYSTYDCLYYGTIQILVIDPMTGDAWSNPAYCRTNTHTFNFDISAPVNRDKARRFLDSIPTGFYIMARNFIYYPFWGAGHYVDEWKSDELTYGTGKSLYHSMKNVGFNKIDSFNRLRVFTMLCKKGSTDFPAQQYFSNDTNELMTNDFVLPISSTSGKMNSVTVGPAVTWKTLKWRTSSLFDTATLADSSSVRITGLDKDNNPSVLYEGTTRDTNLAFISASSYPKLQLQWYNTDTIYRTAPQLDYWRILYDPLPEAALNPSAYFSFTDSVSVGQLMQLNTAIETLNQLPMDSMLVRYKVIDAKNISHVLADKKFRKLSGNDTLHASIAFDPKPYPGKNYLYIEANPDNNQPEEYHPNNLGYIPFSIRTDEYAPVLDVTFDGTHILDQDLISSKPFIKVLLRDENKFLALNDTSSMKLSIRYPSDAPNTRRNIAFDGSTCKFIPADMSAGKNEAYIEFKPVFTEDGTYQLFAAGNDISGNGSGGGNEYSISFKVINKAMISSLLNYPNPFSTSTAFVFTLTGWQVPSQLKIQILTVTGKVVREITKQELGPIRIGRNITEYKWDGKDEYGQMLGNGVYLYRVVSSLEGKDMEHYGNSAVDKFYKNGYSKMYIMR